jgi:hypothetical protein
LVIDYINSSFAEKRLQTSELRDIDGITYQLNRWTDDSYFYKKITIKEALFDKPLAFTERIRKFSKNDFAELFNAHGLTLTHAFGDYDLNEHNEQTSPRLILVAKK